MKAINIGSVFTLALQQAVKKGTQDVRDGTTPGVYRSIVLDVHIEVDEMRVAPDTDKAPTAHIPLLATCALLLQRMGVQREDALNILKDVMTESLTLNLEAKKALLEKSGVAEMEERLRKEVITKLPRVPMKGAVKIDPENIRVTINSMTMEESKQPQGS